MPTPVSFEKEVAEQRAYLFKFARLQLRNEAWAEDAVSETLLAALSKPHAFAGKAQLRTWLVGVLKHKIIDCLRTHLREPNRADLRSFAYDQTRDEDLLDTLDFDADGHFSQTPTDWGNPDRELSQRQFLAVLDACIAKLPQMQGRLFLMREWLELDVPEVCATLNITSTNLYVQLHRARLRLRQCLQLHWFGQQGIDQTAAS